MWNLIDVKILTQAMVNPQITHEDKCTQMKQYFSYTNYAKRTIVVCVLTVNSQTILTAYFTIASCYNGMLHLLIILLACIMQPLQYISA